ncbi:uncharacterized protein si:dkey-52l18.4 isoform X3 [Pygocentrus nattereri]|uniref:uncharacterized protein si:dkey-52l18.4 isoform X3 n=1 Tax=Pygocentrus nattereri TaxID=42514 RepID=UPI0008148940|nr:uncharacterized protein si:dkey-52l18.4 isoform X3 [Pygocentrus nattereri]
MPNVLLNRCLTIILTFSCNLQANRTCLQVNIQNLNQSDSGTYQCSIIWEGKYTSQGHVTYVNVTTGSYEHITVAELAHRKLSHRLLVCAGASCFPLILGLACCLSSKRLRSPPVPPHFRGTSAARVKPKAEVVYAAVILKSQNQPKRPQAREPIVYSSLNFSTV